MILRYFLAAEAFVVLGYIIGNSLFPKRFSLVFYKFFGITMFGLLLWYLSLSTGSEWKSLFPAAIGISALLAIALAAIRQKKIALPDKQELKNFIALEVISLGIYLALVYLRTFKPDILGTEKLMDVALINSILHGGRIPIENPWLSGFLMNYYYFGHFILALLQYIANIPSAIGYNLAISLFGVWIVQAAYLVARGLTLKPAQSLVTAILLAFGGNFYMLITGLFKEAGSQWFASATRVIPYTINEFPAYSIVLGDLHGHYLSFPFFLVAIFLLVDIFFGEKSPEPTDTVIKSSFLGILLGHLYLTNSWDVLTLALLGGIFTGWFAYREYRENSFKNWRTFAEFIFYIGAPVIVFAVPQFIISRYYYLPPVGGIGINTLFSPILDIFKLFGQYLLLALISFAGLFTVYKTKGMNQLKDSKQSIILALLLAGTGFLLMILVEFFYAKDIFTVLNPPYARTNTVFKIYFHVWAFFAFGTMLGFYTMMKEISSIISKKPWLYMLHFASISIFAIMISYTYIAVEQYLVPKAGKETIQRVFDEKYSNGLGYIRLQHPADYELIEYLQTIPHSTILEIATYDSYSYNARLSAYTGHSAVSGWPLHNVQWYNGYDGSGVQIKNRKIAKIEIAQRITDIEALYTEKSVVKVQTLLEKYAIDYVIFGAQEKTWATTKGAELNENIYEQLCDRQWEKNDAIVFKCR